MERFMQALCLLLIGLVIGVACGVLIMFPRTRPSRDFAERCKARLAVVESWSEQEQAKFWKDVHANRALREEWSVTCACARIIFD